MKLTQTAIDEIKQSEGLVLKAYPDPGSVDGLPVTIGYGTTRIDGKAIKLGTVITKDQAEKYLIGDLTVFAAKVAQLIKVPISDAQFGALVSLAYNIGIDAFAKSTLLRILNAGDYAGVPAQFRRWNKNDGKIMQGLINRREREIAMWLQASAEPTDGPKPSTGGVGSPKAIWLLLGAAILAVIGVALFTPIF